MAEGEGFVGVFVVLGIALEADVGPLDGLLGDVVDEFPDGDVDLPAATKAFTAGFVIRQTLAARDPENTEWLRDLFTNHFKLATLAEAAGDAAYPARKTGGAKSSSRPSPTRANASLRRT